MATETRKYILIILIFIPSFIFSAQNSESTDSLLKNLSIVKNDSVKLNLLLKLFWEYRRSNPDKALEIVHEALEISRTGNNAMGTAQSLHNIGIIWKAQGKYDSALIIISDAKDLYINLNDTTGIVSCLTDIGDIHNRQNNYTRALEYLNEARNLIDLTDNKQKLSRIYNKLGGIYNTQKQFEKALEYHLKSLEINKDLNFELGMSVNYNNIGNVFLDLKKYDKAMENYLKSLEIKKEIRDESGIASILNNLGLIYSRQDNHIKALEYHTEALEIFEKLGDQPRIAMCYVNISNDYLETGNYPLAITFSEKSLALSDKLNLKRTQTESYRILSEANAAQNQFKKAYHYQKLFKIYHDSTVNVEVVRQITEMESRYEVEKKENEIALLNAEKEKQSLAMQKQRLQRNLMIGLTTVVLVILLFLFWNIRNTQKLNRKLKELNLTKSRFFANISHEFRTPLTLLLGPLEKLLASARKEDKEMIGMMHRNATRLLFLDNQLLDLAKLEAGKLSLKVSQSNITQSLKGMVMSFQSLAEKRQIEFTYLFPENNITGYFDQDKLEKIVYNLLSNALKFTPEKGNVVFKLSQFSNKKKKELPQALRKTNGQIIGIMVSDTGLGISKENRSHIFDRFYQVDSSTKRNFEGTGLGLSLTKELVELHHGKITVDSAMGKGSKFNVYLPIDKKAYELQEIETGNFESDDISVFADNIHSNDRFIKPEKEEKTAAAITDKKIQVLIVEDNSDMRLYIKDCFDERFFVNEAENGNTGFDLAASEIPDIIISDLMMPEVDGIELCNRLKTDQRTSHIPVILLTALSSVEDRIKGLETGADDYIAKPFNRQELLTRVKNLTDQRRLLWERFSKEIKIQPKDIAITSADEKFLNKLISFIEKNLADPDLNVDSLTEEIHLSRSQLHRKLKALTNLSTTEFIRSIRLKRAAQLLEQHHGTIAETVYAVGFNSLSYFAKCFQKEFNMTPKEYIDQN